MLADVIYVAVSRIIIRWRGISVNGIRYGIYAMEILIIGKDFIRSPDAIDRIFKLRVIGLVAPSLAYPLVVRIVPDVKPIIVSYPKLSHTI
jgi:hypothetical protein